MVGDLEHQWLHLVFDTMSRLPKALSQLFSSMTQKMERLFVSQNGYRPPARPIRPFKICIVDEASQCVEPEMLIPFPLGFQKLIIIGDHNQLYGGSHFFTKLPRKKVFGLFVSFCISTWAKGIDCCKQVTASLTEFAVKKMPGIFIFK